MKNKKPRVLIEIWKPIKNFEGLYEVSDQGRIKSLIRKQERIRKPSKQKSGYLQVTLNKKGKPYYKWVHRIVAETFLNQIDGKNYVNHKDGNKHNNIPENLEYCTMAENNYHAGQLNLKPIGSNHTNSKLTHEDLKHVRDLLNMGNLTHKEIAKKFGLHRTAISRIARGESYRKEIT
jgi:hypothetical protein